MGDAARLMFASDGRIGRGPFILAIAGLVAVFAAYEAAVRGAWHAASGWLVHLILFFCAASVLAKRLHDRGRSGWWAAVVLLAFAVVWPRPEGVVDWLFVLVLVGAAVELGVRPGQAGPNRFGPPNGG